jgi:hypothetical protein
MNIYEILDEIEQAYPEDIFPSLTQQEIVHMMVNEPGIIGRASASLGRHLAQLIRRKLEEKEDDEKEGPVSLLAQATRKILDGIYEFGAPMDDGVYIDQAEKALERLKTWNRKKSGAGELIDAVQEFLKDREDLMNLNPPILIAYPAINRIESALKKIREGDGSDARLRKAAQALLDYRKRAGPLNFQLEKADDFLREISLALAGEVSDPPLQDQ